MRRVESATGQVWVFPDAAAERVAEAMAQRHRLPELLCRVLAARGVGPDEATGFLQPRLDRLMPDPALLADMPAAAARLAAAVRGGHSVGLFGDYDADGASSVALLAGWLRELGVDCTWTIPHRLRDGYGPKPELLAELGARHELVIIVDSGSAAEAAPGIAAARGAGADVIVADHHVCEPGPARDYPFLNPVRPDDRSGLACLCAAGVVFMLLVASTRELRDSGWFAGAGRAEPALDRGLDLVALATVADAVPLTGLNRALVRFGLRRMQAGMRPGLRALFGAGAVPDRITGTHLGWVLGPRLNAPGRVGSEAGDRDLPVRLLLSGSEAEAVALAGRCAELNDLRRDLQARVLGDIEAGRCRGGETPGFVWHAEAGPGDWHPGVVGIVAGRLAERRQRPAIILARDGAVFRGSGRSYGGLDLGSPVRAARAAGKLRRGGGHRAAVGLEVAAGELDGAMEMLAERLAAAVAGTDMRPLVPVLGSVAPTAITAELHDQLALASPFGQEAPEPRFVLGRVRLRYPPQVLKETHYRLQLADADGRSVKGMAFAAGGTPLGAVLARLRSGDLVDAMGEIAIDDYRGRRQAYLRVVDIARR